MNPFESRPPRFGEIQVIHGIVPSKSNCYKIITIKPKDGRRPFYSLGKRAPLAKYEKDFMLQCNVYRNANIEGEFNFEMQVFYPTRRADLDGSLKVVLDCLQKVKAFKNDNRCSRIVLDRFVDAENPRVEFVITQ